VEDEEYELVSREEVDRLKREVEHLKSNPFVQNSTDDKLYDSVRKLNDSVNKLYVLFDSINKQLLKEYQSGESPEEKINILLEQNKSIAEAMVAFGSKIDDLNSQSNNSQKVTSQSISQQPINQQSINQPQQIRQTQQAPTDSFLGINQQAPQQQVIQPMQQQPMQAPMQMPQPPRPMPQQMQNSGMNREFNSQSQQMQVPQPRMQMPQGSNDSFSSSLPPLQPPQNVNFTTRVDPNYPVPDRFQGLNVPSAIGEPINVLPSTKKKGFLGLGR